MAQVCEGLEWQESLLLGSSVHEHDAEAQTVSRVGTLPSLQPEDAEK